MDARTAVFAFLVATVGLVAMLSCRSPEAEPRRASDSLATEEVAPPLDRGASIETDPTAPAPSSSAGQKTAGLPGGFPREVPWPELGGIVDSGPAPGGAWVEWVVPRPVREARPAYLRQLAAAGFQADGGTTYRRGEVALRVTVTDFGSEGARIRVEPLGREARLGRE